MNTIMYNYFYTMVEEHSTGVEDITRFNREPFTDFCMKTLGLSEEDAKKQLMRTFITRLRKVLLRKVLLFLRKILKNSLNMQRISVWMKVYSNLHTTDLNWVGMGRYFIIGVIFRIMKPIVVALRI